MAEIREVLDLDHKRRRRWWLLVPVVALLLALVVWASRPAPAPGWNSTPLTRGDLQVEVTAVGTVEPLSQVDITSEQSGTVVNVFVQANDQVKAGQVLAQLDDAMLEARVQEAEASVDSARASLEQARSVASQAHRDLDRTRSLLRQGATSQVSFDAALAAHEQAAAASNLALAQLRQAQAELSIASINLDKSRLTSPIDGVVLRRDVEPGQALVSTLGQPSFRVAGALEQMKVEVQVDEADIDLVHAGQPATFTVPAFDDRVFEAQVLSVDLAPNTDVEVVSYDAILGVENPDKALVPGMTATATVGVELHEDVLLVPGAALRFTPEGQMPEPLEAGLGRIWVEDVDGHPRPLVVVIGPSDGSVTAVEGTDLREGLPVITAAAEGA